jgi:subfamily B ATP-binding cassette protein MsbA
VRPTCRLRGALPQGLDTPIGHNGSQLSGGQRQRLAIARAIYKDAPILILDEATSALDSRKRTRGAGRAGALMQGRTTLVIAHRLSTIEHADRVLVLEAGRLVEQGSHAQLLAQGGLYARLHAMQFRSP